MAKQKRARRKREDAMNVRSTELTDISDVFELETLVHSDERGAMRREYRASCLVQSTSTGALREGRVLDLSPEGMRVAVDFGAELGDELLLSFRPPRWVRREELLARTQVVRVDQGARRELDLGLRFVNLPAPLRIELDACLRGLPPPLPHPGTRAAHWLAHEDVDELDR